MKISSDNICDIILHEWWHSNDLALMHSVLVWGSEIWDMKAAEQLKPNPENTQ